MTRCPPLLLLGVLLPLACASPASRRSRSTGGLDCRGERGPAVVFIPGASRSGDDWDAVRAALEPGVKTCAWTPPFGGPRTADGDATRLLAALEGRAEAWVLVGHSYGGLVARQVAAREPTRLRGVLFVDAVHEDLFDPAQAFPVSEQQPLDWVASFREAARAGVPRGVPVFALAAEHSDEAALAAQRRLVAAGVPGEVSVVPRAGHHIPRDRPDAIADAARRLLGLVGASSP